MKLIIIGASGFIGASIYQEAKKQDIEVIGTATTDQYSHLHEFDMLKDNIANFIENSNQNDITHAIITASVSIMKKCLENPVRATAINITATKNLLDYFHANKIKTLFLSTEQVFDGTKGYYKETDQANPLSMYGKQKLDIENYILEKMPEFLIYRLSETIGGTLFGRHIFKEFYNHHLENKTLQCISGLIISPTYVQDTAKYCLRGLEEDLQGLYHMANPNKMSRYDLTRKFLDKIGSSAKINEISVNDFQIYNNSREKKPVDTSIDVSKFLAKVQDAKFTSMDEVIEIFIANVKKNFKEKS